MAVSLHTLISRSMARLGAVHPMVKEYTSELITRCYKEGIRVQISSGFRSFEEQAHIYGQGRSSYVYKGKQYGRLKDGNGKRLSIVSNAKPGSSIHNYGLAIDYFLVSPDGNSSIWTVNNDWRRVAAIAKSMGAEWGGDWSSFRDYPHLQWNKGLTIKQLAAGKRPTLQPLKKPVPVVEKEKEEFIRMFKPTTEALKQGSIEAIKTARKNGIILSDRWEKAAENGTLSLDDAVSLSFLIGNGKKK